MGGGRNGRIWCHQYPLRRILRDGAAGSKKLVAYSSVSHMGFTLLALGALTPQGIQACLVQMFNHGLITGMLFSLVGVVYDRVHTRDIDRFGGLASEMPLYTAFVGFAFMASLGLPGLSGFWGEAMTFIGAFPRYAGLTMMAATGVIVTAAYHLWAFQRMFLGKFREEWRSNKYLEAFSGKFPEIECPRACDACASRRAGPGARILAAPAARRHRPRFPRRSSSRRPPRARADRRAPTPAASRSRGRAPEVRSRANHSSKHTSRASPAFLLIWFS